MSASSKFLYYTSRVIHILLLPILYIGLLWFHIDGLKEVVGLILLFTIPINQLVIRSHPNLLLVVRLVTYIIVIVSFFPVFLFTDQNPINYKNVIFFDMCFLAVVDISIYIEKWKLKKFKELE